jgi:hypothetical protein
MPPRARTTAALVLVVLGLAPVAAAQETPRDPKAQELFQAALEARNGRLESIDDYTIVRALNGAEATAYFEKRVVDGYPHHGRDTPVGLRG